MPRKKREETAIGGRLNHVRELVGAKDLKAFFEGLGGKNLRGFPSYPAVCTYHGKPWRDPPTVYLAQIARVHDISLDWLITDDGSPYRWPEEARTAERLVPFRRAVTRAREQLVELRFHDFYGMEEILQGLVIRFLRSGGRSPADYTEEQVEEAVLALGWIMTFPGLALGSTDYVNEGHGEEFFMAMATALRIAMPQTDRGFPLNALENTRRLREAWQDRLPYETSDDATKELTRQRRRGPKQEDTDGTP